MSRSPWWLPIIFRDRFQQIAQEPVIELNDLTRLLEVVVNRVAEPLSLNGPDVNEVLALHQRLHCLSAPSSTARKKMTDFDVPFADRLGRQIVHAHRGGW